MGWVQHHRQHGAMLALIALALQIVFTFGHVHLHGLGGSSHIAIAGQVSLPHAPPKVPAPIPDDDGYCAVCASIFLASTAFAPAPPQLPLTANFERVEHPFSVTAALTARPHLAFRSRAPPAA
jgi:hypothetical protein